MKYLVAASLFFSFSLWISIAQAARPADELTRTVRAEMDKQAHTGAGVARITQWRADSQTGVWASECRTQCPGET